MFIAFLDKFIGMKERDILVAWNGASCDLEWIYCIIYAAGKTLALPPRVKYILDPYRGIEITQGCKLNKNNSKLQSYSLGSVHERAIGERLPNAHCSLVDAKAQISIVLCNEFYRVCKTKSSVKYISEMFTKKKKQMDALYEPHRVVHKSCSAEEKAGIWEPSCQYQYLGGSQGRSEAKPAVRIVDKSPRGKCTIDDLFFEYSTAKGIFEPMSKLNQYYACEEFFAPVNQSWDSNKKENPKQ